MLKALPTKETEKTWTTKNPYLREAPIRWPMPEQCLFQPTEVSLATPMAVCETSNLHESVKQNTNERAFSA